MSPTPINVITAKGYWTAIDDFYGLSLTSRQVSQEAQEAFFQHNTFRVLVRAAHPGLKLAPGMYPFLARTRSIEMSTSHYGRRDSIFVRILENNPSCRVSFSVPDFQVEQDARRRLASRIRDGLHMIMTTQKLPGQGVSEVDFNKVYEVVRIQEQRALFDIIRPAVRYGAYSLP